MVIGIIGFLTGLFFGIWFLCRMSLSLPAAAIGEPKRFAVLANNAGKLLENICRELFGNAPSLFAFTVAHSLRITGDFRRAAQELRSTSPRSALMCWLMDW